MSIRIVSPGEVTQTAGTIPPLLFANLKNLYSRRAERLQQLAENHPLGDYLRFIASIVEAQQSVLQNNPLSVDLQDVLTAAEKTHQAPLSVKHFARTDYWRMALTSIIEELQPQAPENIAVILENLLKISDQELEDFADYLLAGEYHRVGSDKAIFIWAALSLYWAQLAHQLPGKAKTELGEQRHFCPVCDSAPVASIVHIGNESGLRYLHCSLCESEWHVVRIKCSNCEQTGKLNYWSLDSETAPIKAESCGDCGSYLKVFYQEKDPYIDVIADDLASLILDAKMEGENFAKSGVNPFLFPGEGE